MSITLDAIALPEDLIWSNEYDWSKVTQDVKKSLTGALIIQESSQSEGRLITLTGGTDFAWITKATLDLIQAEIDTVDNTMILTINGQAYTVIFIRAGNTSPMVAKQIKELSNPDADDFYSITLNFMEV